MGRLEADFAALAADVGVDVCRYRFFADYVRPTVNPVGNALLYFQSAFTLAFNAIKNGPQQIARITPDIEELTAFGVGYAYDGSLGIVLTFSNKQFGLFESVMDEAMGSIFELANAQSSAELARQGKRLGPPTIKAIYNWASSHAKYGLGADIAWVHGEQQKNRLVLESAAMARLVDILQNTSHTETETIVVEGMFSGGEYMTKHTFHFVADDNMDYRGRYTDAISEENPVQWPKRYRAHIQKTVKVFYTSDAEDKPSYLLVRLDSLN